MEWPKITKDTPLEEIKAIHQRIWDYVIEHGEKPKTSYIANCVACHFAHVIRGFQSICSRCPISWLNQFTCSSVDGLYTRWLYEKDPEKELDLARQIRDMPFKYELES